MKEIKVKKTRVFFIVRTEDGVLMDDSCEGEPADFYPFFKNIKDARDYARRTYQRHRRIVKIASRIIN